MRLVVATAVNLLVGRQELGERATLHEVENVKNKKRTKSTNESRLSGVAIGNAGSFWSGGLELSECESLHSVCTHYMNAGL